MSDDCQRAGEIIARVTRKSRLHRSAVGIIRSVPLWVWTRGAGSQQMEAARSWVFVVAVLLGVASALDREGG